jgi:acetyl-CoA carboxylase biotin carboxyl carrier protein
MDLRKLKTLIDLVSESNVSELEITEAEGKVRIVKGGGMMPQAYAMPVAAMPMPAVTPMSATVAPSAADQVVAAEPDVSHAVKSPMVGTFYRSASPGSKPFVEVGDTIKQGETLCIIEAMKILNEIESDKTGTVTKILCDNGQAVEYGQSLYLID